MEAVVLEYEYYDDEAPEDAQLLMAATKDFCFIIFMWTMIGWTLRLLYLAITLRELTQAQERGQITVHADVPLHDHVVPMDVDVRRRFLGWLRTGGGGSSSPLRKQNDPGSCPSILLEAGRRHAQTSCPSTHCDVLLTSGTSDSPGCSTKDLGILSTCDSSRCTRGTIHTGCGPPLPSANKNT